jgi:hypothetical protein
MATRKRTHRYLVHVHVLTQFMFAVKTCQTLFARKHWLMKTGRPRWLLLIVVCRRLTPTDGHCFNGYTLSDCYTFKLPLSLSITGAHRTGTERAHHARE